MCSIYHIDIIIAHAHCSLQIVKASVNHNVNNIAHTRGENVPHIVISQEGSLFLIGPYLCSFVSR